MPQQPFTVAVFALERAGIYCRIQPGQGFPPGFYVVANADGESPNLYNAAQLFESILARKTGAIMIQNQADPITTGSLWGDTYEAKIGQK